jgi:CheY-like chemotaxis protein
MTDSTESYAIVVDDDPDARRIFSRIVSKLGVSAKVAENGKQALEMIQASPPRLIVLDLMMPVMDGFQVLSYLQASPNLRHIPVIVISGYSFGSSDMRLPGVKHVMQKAGFSISELEKLVGIVLADKAEQEEQSGVRKSLESRVASREE